MKAISALVESKQNMTIGNHAVEHLNNNGFTRKFTYHGNTICLVDDKRKLIILTNAGWNTSSTTRALNEYRRYFVNKCVYALVGEGALR